MPSHREEAELLGVMKEAAKAVRSALSELDDWGPTGGRPGEYRCDVVADEAVLSVLSEKGLAVVSEESGAHEGRGGLVVVVDPVDGSTNAAQGIPWFATSLCAMDDAGPLASVVVDQANGRVFQAVRGGGARVDGRTIQPSGKTELGRAIVAFCGVPRRYLGWSQARVLGAAALDLCAVAEGVLDAYADSTGGSLAPWDYLGALLVCREAGAAVGEAQGADLWVSEHSARRAPLAAATPELLEELRGALKD